MNVLAIGINQAKSNNQKSNLQRQKAYATVNQSMLHDSFCKPNVSFCAKEKIIAQPVQTLAKKIGQSLSLYFKNPSYEKQWGLDQQFIHEMINNNNFSSKKITQKIVQLIGQANDDNTIMLFKPISKMDSNIIRYGIKSNLNKEQGISNLRLINLTLLEQIEKKDLKKGLNNLFFEECSGDHLKITFPFQFIATTPEMNKFVEVIDKIGNEKHVDALVELPRRFEITDHLIALVENKGSQFGKERLQDKLDPRFVILPKRDRLSDYDITNHNF